MTIAQALKICLSLISKKVKHKHYNHVVKLRRDLYRPLVTGEEADHLIQRFNLRETAADHAQRVRLTVLITQAITNTLMAPARKITKVQPVVNVATFGTDAKDNDEKLLKAAATFYSGKSVDHFFGSVLLDQGAIDPNAFCMVLFDPFDARFETPRPYPSIISCEDAWNFEYFNGELLWLLVHRDIKYTVREGPPGAVKPSRRAPQKPKEPREKDGHAFWLYTDQNHILFSQVDSATVSNSIEGIMMDANGKALVNDPTLTSSDTPATYYFRTTKETLYEVKFYEHRTGLVQGFRLGYVPDQRTKGDTMVNLWHAGVPFMLKGIKAGSELDLSAAMHAFLQKIQYSNQCRGYTDEKGTHTDCNKGFQPDGNQKCKACGGDGYETHRSGMDHITMAMPRDKTEFLELENMVRYVTLPVEVLQWQDGYVDKLERGSYRAVYNSDRFQADTATPANITATGDVINLQNIYDTIKPGADWFSQSRVLVYKLLASYMVGSEALKTLKVEHVFPRNMRFETLGERVMLLKSLREAGAMVSAMAQVNMDILRDVYADDPEGLKKAITQAYFDPFAGKSEATIVSMISQDLTTRKLKVYYTNMSAVYARAEMEQSDPVIGFYDMDRKKQAIILEKIVSDLLEEIEGDADQAMERMQLGMEAQVAIEGGDGAGDDPGPKAGPKADPTGKGLPPSPGNKATG